MSDELKEAIEKTIKEVQEPLDNKETPEKKEAKAEPKDKKEDEKPDPSKKDEWEYTGDRKSVPENFLKYSKGFDRYASKKDLVISETKKQLEETQATLDSEGYKKYLEANKSKEEPPLFTQEEADAISLGDATTLQNVVKRAVAKAIESDVAPRNKEMDSKIDSLSQKERLVDAKERMSDFGKINPDFAELVESPIGDHIIGAVQRGASLEDAYKSAKEVEAYVAEKAEKTRLANLEAKKNGSVVKGSVPGSPDIVWAENEDDAKRLAIQLELKKDPRTVRIKDKTK